MRKAPPKTHTYTIVALLAVIVIAGGVLATEHMEATNQKSDAAHEVSREASRESMLANDRTKAVRRESDASSGSALDVTGSETPQDNTRQNSLNPQQPATRLQPASGSEVYANHDTQTTANPGQNE